MLRVESETGWWLVTHPDHAHLAGVFAAHWGNETFAAPRPRSSVLYGIHVHDDGWAVRDARPSLTRQGKPSAFSHELVGKYSAFEEIDLADYLAVRERAVALVEAEDAYAALLVSMHTFNLLTERADRTTIDAEQLPLLDDCLLRQQSRMTRLREIIRADTRLTADDVSDETILDNFRLLQATDNLSLLSCVDYQKHGTLLHPMRTSAGGTATVDVFPLGPREFRVVPYPFDQPELIVPVPARHVEGKVFAAPEDFAAQFGAAKPVELSIRLCR